MTEVAIGNKHIYRVLPIMGVCYNVPEDISVLFNVTTLSNVSLSTQYSQSTIDENYIYIDTYREEKYAHYPYNSSIFPNKQRITYQSLNFKYHFEDMPIALISILYDYTLIAPTGVESLITNMKLVNKTDADIKTRLSKYEADDVQDWIDAVDAGDTGDDVVASNTKTVKINLINEAIATELN